MTNTEKENKRSTHHDRRYHYTPVELNKSERFPKLVTVHCELTDRQQKFGHHVYPLRMNNSL